MSALLFLQGLAIILWLSFAWLSFGRYHSRLLIIRLVFIRLLFILAMLFIMCLLFVGPVLLFTSFSPVGDPRTSNSRVSSLHAKLRKDTKFEFGSQSLASSASAPAQTPPMGWNSWYALGEESGWPTTDEKTIMETADALISTGLAEVGYRCECPVTSEACR